MTQKEQQPTFVRFSLSQRIEHILLLISFGMLCLTGLPQMFHGAAWAQLILSAFGGIGTIRVIHHIFAFILAFEFLYHVIVVAYELLFVRPRRLTMLPRTADVRNAVQTVAYLAGRRAEEPKAGRYDFKQKIEYWAMMWGLVVMGATGFILMFAVDATRVLPGVLVPTAKVAHGYEALLAFLAIVTWHFYNAHMARTVFPLDTAIFTGRISRERMLAEHPLEHEQLALAGSGSEGGAAASKAEGRAGRLT
ncbi:MAG: cytochrome C [Chloroflexi bacterium]|nr:MAG: cytochrome C [Chloroflexota bacterium]